MRKRGCIHWTYYFNEQMENDLSIPRFWCVLWFRTRSKPFGNEASMTIIGDKRRPAGRIAA